jgi:hypothetical protein
MDIHFFYNDDVLTIWQNCMAVPRAGDFVRPTQDYDKMEVIDVVWLNRQVVEIHLR